MYSIVTLVNKNVLHIWKLLKARSQNDLITRKKYCITIWRHVNYTYYGDHFAMYTNIICQLCLNQKKNDILSKTKGKQRQKLKNDKTEKAVSLLISCDKLRFKCCFGLAKFALLYTKEPHSRRN